MTALVIGTVIIILTAVLSQAARESLLLLSGYLGPRIIQRAVKALPAKRRVIREPEWLAEFQEKLDKGFAFGGLTFALGCLIGAHRIRREAPREVRNNKAKRSALLEAAWRAPQLFIRKAANGTLSTMVAMWTAALAGFGIAIVLQSRGREHGWGAALFSASSFYAFSGFGVLARRVQLKRRKHRLDRTID